MIPITSSIVAHRCACCKASSCMNLSALSFTLQRIVQILYPSTFFGCLRASPASVVLSVRASIHQTTNNMLHTNTDAAALLLHTPRPQDTQPC